MTKYVFSVPPDMTIHELIRFFVSHPVSAVPVTDEDNNLLGIVSENDVLYKNAKPYGITYRDILGATIFGRLNGGYDDSFKKLLATEASEIMTKDVRSVSPETDMETITSMMINEHLKSIPVVVRNRLVGIVTRHDILTVLAASSDKTAE